MLITVASLDEDFEAETIVLVVANREAIVQEKKARIAPTVRVE